MRIVPIPRGLPQQQEIDNRILIVEDDPLMGIVYRSAFKKHAKEFACHLEMSGEAGLDYLCRQSVDAVILDWDLPGIKGLGLLKAVRSHPAAKTAGILVISGRSADEYKAVALEHGADDYLSKPFEIEEMLVHLRNITRRGQSGTSPLV